MRFTHPNISRKGQYGEWGWYKYSARSLSGVCVDRLRWESWWVMAWWDWQPLRHLAVGNLLLCKVHWHSHLRGRLPGMMPWAKEPCKLYVRKKRLSVLVNRIWIPPAGEAGQMTKPCNPSTPEAETGGWGIKAHPQWRRKSRSKGTVDAVSTVATRTEGEVQLELIVGLS